jgi:hypothetical protein
VDNQPENWRRKKKSHEKLIVRQSVLDIESSHADNAACHHKPLFIGRTSSTLIDSQIRAAEAARLT